MKANLVIFMFGLTITIKHKNEFNYFVQGILDIFYTKISSIKVKSINSINLAM